MSRDPREIARGIVRAHVRKSYKDRMLPQDEELIAAFAATIEKDRAETIERCATYLRGRAEEVRQANEHNVSKMMANIFDGEADGLLRALLPSPPQEGQP